MKEENDVIIDPKERNKKKASNFVGILFLVWFFASIIGMIYFAEKEQAYYVIMIFGQYFLVFGSIAFFNCEGKEKLSSMPFILVGLACIIIPFLMMHPEIFNVSINWEAVIPLLMILIFVITGLALIILPILHKIKLKRNPDEAGDFDENSIVFTTILGILFLVVSIPMLIVILATSQFVL